MGRLRNVKWMVLTLSFLFLSPEALPQDQKPINKASFLKVARESSLSGNELIQFIVERKVDFRLTADEERELAGIPEGSKLIDAVRNNYREENKPPSPQVILPEGPPLNANQVVTLLQAEVDPAIVARLVEKRFVSFSTSKQVASEILAAGGTKELVGTIAASFVEPPPPPLPSPQPSGPDKPVRPPPPPPTGPISVGEAEQARKLIHKVTPQYPQIAKALRIQGTVVLEVVIRADGLVKSTRVLSGGKTALSEAAQSAVRAWRYAPTMQNGYLMEVKTQVEIKFTL